MVKLADQDIQTREVLDWQGIHVLHSQMSSCSAKLRIFLNIKQVNWHSHPIDLTTNQNMSDWYLGINPRGLVPVLVQDGDVHIESNDILLHLEKQLSTPCLIPDASASKIAELLQHEDDLHLDLRTLSFRFVFAPPSNPKPPKLLEQFARSGSGTVNGKADPGKAEQIAYWEKYEEEGITDSDVRRAASQFRAAFVQLEDHLATSKYLLGNDITVVDIAWFVYVNRLSLAGYPFERLHPRLAAWFLGLLEKPKFAGEVTLPPPLRAHIDSIRRRDVADKRTLEDVAGL